MNTCYIIAKKIKQVIDTIKILINDLVKTDQWKGKYPGGHANIHF